MSNQINYKTALRCAHLSNEVYRTFNDKLRFSLSPTLIPQLIENKPLDTQVALLEDSETQCGYVVFRGSDADRDWFNAEGFIYNTMTDLIDRTNGFFFVQHDQEMWGGKLDVTTEHQLFGRDNQFVFGVDYQDLDFERTRGFRFSAVPGDSGAGEEELGVGDARAQTHVDREVDLRAEDPADHHPDEQGGRDLRIQAALRHLPLGDVHRDQEGDRHHHAEARHREFEEGDGEELGIHGAGD